MALNDLTVPAGDENEFQRLLDTLYTRYQDDIENLTDAATDEIETAIRRGDLDLKEIVRDYTDSASQLSRDYYHTVRQVWQEYAGEQFPEFDDGGLVDPDRVLWQTQHGFAGSDYTGVKYSDVKTGSNKAGLTMDDLWPDMTDIDDAQQFIADMIRNALRSQTQQCMRRDPTQPRWARVPQGRTCAFCVMLASRGFAYLSAETAGKGGARFHSDCDCRVIPSWGKQTLKGYDPDEYHRLYRDARDIASSTGERTVLKALRRIDPESVTDGVFPDDNKMSRDNSLSYRKWHEHVKGVKERKRKDRTRLFRQYSVCKIPPLTPLEPPVWDDDTLIRFTAKTWNHSLFGYDAGGGHLFGYGWIYGKPEFPEDWTAEDIANAARVILGRTREKWDSDAKLGRVSGIIDGLEICVAFGTKKGVKTIRSIFPKEVTDVRQRATDA